jgi:hypothetical protein
VGELFAGVELVQLLQLAPQALTSFATHAPPQKWVPPVHWHAPLTQCLPPLHASPHPLQLLSSLVVSTHAPAHGVYPLLQEKVHALATHVGWAWAMLVAHACAQAPQLPGLLVVSTHVPLHSVDVAPKQPVPQE